MEIREILSKLCRADGVSGAEEAACAEAVALLREFDPSASADPFGCVHAFIGEKGNGKKTLLLEAHIDEIGFIVTYIEEGGFLRVANVGGTDRRLYAAQTVTIHSDPPLKGVIATLPPHVDPDGKKTMKTEAIAIDTGFSKEETEKRVKLGDRVTIDGGFAELGESRVTAKALDDRAGAAAILYALSLLKGKKLAYNLSILFASEEEVGSRGAKIGAYTAEADLAVATDVSFGLTPDAKREKCGELGKGAMLGIAPSLSKSLTEHLRALAEEEDIPLQLEIMGGETGTDADEIATARGGVKTALLSIPLRYMHTPVETVDPKDVEAVGRLMAALALKGEGGEDNA
ncbi:MAG: M20/M25/M40 family metallo-hydrolase [Bacteroides sp.]|nr:M20/M25/M40 family metallo-hydrolase [Eubacterium sp.]MCM1417581.1 M20/M25/M40 family metallo-hydrolase [Roseburia sp.]MCM1461708.1 M20/M25/M40 family metallo-hydrolase [Bacteroides sp.]